MKQGNNNRRGRGRGPRKPHGPHSGGMSKGNQTFDSNGPEVRVRGNAHQVLEKYLQMARDAGSAGDRVAAENYLQHAEHYYRVIAAQAEGQRPRVGGRELSVADVNVQNVSQGLSAALYSGSANNMGMNGDGEIAGEQGAAPANGAYGGEDNGRFNAYENGGTRGSTRGPTSREAGRENNAMRESRDAGSMRDGNGEDQGAPAPAPAPRRAPRAAPAPAVGDEQPDYPAELLPTVAPAAAAPAKQPSLDLAPAEAESSAEGAEAPAPRRGRGRPRGSSNRRPRAAATGGDSEAPAPAAAPAETGD
ncbi:DUF4167 domain-containing protein [Dongia soli]|uniref:DUF4167 domain-containing protein n=1 Tax=Dongia soli TaxID=600628 RepID=A0ABU5E8K2_9PROT|nr:DUF4167 domain-containing protein [Dongia soli]MDY0882491.1 DUF4167 domain-containing protein [Dongia soli]